MTSLDQAGESQQHTIEQQTMDQPTGEHPSGNEKAEDHTAGMNPTEEHRDEDHSGAEQTDSTVAGEPIASQHSAEEQSTEHHSDTDAAGYEDSPGASLQTPLHSEEPSAGQSDESSDSGAAGGANPDYLTSDTVGGDQEGSAEQIDALMDDHSPEAPENALGHEAPGASAGHPDSSELAEMEHMSGEPGEQTSDGESINGSELDGNGASTALANGQAQRGELESGPAHDGKFMQTFFEDLLNALGVQGSIAVRGDNQDEVTLEIRNCPDASLIIGRHGQTVDDLQYLGSLVLNNNRRDRRRFMLNVENYRERREESLRLSAVALARQVAELGQEAVLDPLPPHERRIVHMALEGITEVYTYSEGVEPDRRIVISPRNAGGVAATEEGVEDLTTPAREEDAAPPDGLEEAGETVNTGDSGVLNEAFGETDSISQQIGRDPTEFGLADEEPASGEGGDSAGHNSYELDGDEPTLPPSPAGGGSHGGHTGED
ncbi:MAG: KH domain-containing protein [Armatimonadota bacterium]|nr:KH domain-containing protein [Armatimonadota bacterium]